MCSATYDYADIAGGHDAEEGQRQRGERERGGVHPAIRSASWISMPAMRRKFFAVP
jgi:hypothetical protein